MVVWCSPTLKRAGTDLQHQRESAGWLPLRVLFAVACPSVRAFRFNVGPRLSEVSPQSQRAGFCIPMSLAGGSPLLARMVGVGSPAAGSPNLPEVFRLVRLRQTCSVLRVSAFVSPMQLISATPLGVAGAVPSSDPRSDRSTFPPMWKLAIVTIFGGFCSLALRTRRPVAAGSSSVSRRLERHAPNIDARRTHPGGVHCCQSCSAPVKAGGPGKECSVGCDGVSIGKPISKVKHWQTNIFMLNLACRYGWHRGAANERNPASLFCRGGSG